jgi:phosphatidylglycerol:prolipoprotein diacylglycerol transferase
MNYYTHDLNPIAFSISEFVMPWYWLFYLLGCIWALLYTRYLSEKKFVPLSLKDIRDYFEWGWVALFLGARVVYVLVYNLSYYLDHPEQIYKIWLGGMSFHGAILGILISTYLIAKKKKQNLFHFCDSLSTCVPLVLAFGRIGNFINGELAGRYSNVPWAVIFPRYDLIPRHPSQLYQSLLEGLLIFVIMHLNRSKLKYAGYQSANFLIFYGVFRFITEFFREPDRQLGYYLNYFSMGQFLCLAMIFSGLFIHKKFVRKIN